MRASRSGLWAIYGTLAACRCWPALLPGVASSSRLDEPGIHPGGGADWSGAAGAGPGVGDSERPGLGAGGGESRGKACGRPTGRGATIAEGSDAAKTVAAPPCRARPLSRHPNTIALATVESAQPPRINPCNTQASWQSSMLIIWGTGMAVMLLPVLVSLLGSSGGWGDGPGESMDESWHVSAAGIVRAA